MIMNTLLVREATGSSENIGNYYHGYRIPHIVEIGNVTIHSGY